MVSFKSRHATILLVLVHFTVGIWSIQAQEPRSLSTPEVTRQVENLINNPDEVSIKGGRVSTAASHFQGMGVLADGTFVMSHGEGSLKGKNRDYGYLYFVNPVTRKYLGEIDFKIPSDVKAYPSGIQACGNIIAVSVASQGWTGVKFFEYSNFDSVEELTHLELEWQGGGTVENVALAWHPDLSRYVLAVKGRKVYLSDSDDLTDTNTQFQEIGDINIKLAEAGHALIHESGNRFYLFGLGRYGDDEDSPNGFTVSPLTIASGGVDSSWAGTEYELEDSAGNFRWAGTANVNNSGNLEIIAAPREQNALGRSSYGIWTSETGSPPPGKKTFKLTVTGVVCYKTSERGEDEIFLKFGNGDRYPTDKQIDIDDDSGSNRWRLVASVTFLEGTTMALTLMEHDHVADDILVEHTVAATANADARVIGRGDGSEYRIYYKVTEVK